MGSVEVPQQQKAAIRQGSGADATAPVGQIPVSQPGPGQILVKIKWTGLCASDKSLIHDEWSGFGVAMSEATKGIAGHEGAGVVVAVGEGMQNKWKIGDRAGIKWVASTCAQFWLYYAGTFQEYCLADGRYTSRIPDGVQDEEAGPIMCGGITAYKACKTSAVQPGQWIVLPGAGGGLGHFAVQYAKAMGMRVIAIDGGDEKRDLCKRLGAEVFIDYKTTEDITAEVMKITTYGAHAVLVTAATKEAYALAPMLLRPGGAVVVVGLPADPSVVAGAPPILLALRRLKILGIVVGTLKDVEEALDFSARGLVKPILTKGKLEDLDDYMYKLMKGQLSGRAVLQAST